MTVWTSFGASVRGPGHVRAGAPNQDAWSAFHHTWGDGIAVSDGLGSKPLSGLGSVAACLAVKHAAQALGRQIGADPARLFDCVSAHWLALLAPLVPRDCSATCLLAVRPGDGAVHLAMLGDGLVAALRSDGSVVSLSEDKSRGFSNVTVALSPSVTAADWRYLALREDDCAAVLLCTDGVSDDLDDADGFIQGVVQAHRGYAAARASRQLGAMLENWPTPQHSDDKTIACLQRKEAIHG